MDDDNLVTDRRRLHDTASLLPSLVFQQTELTTTKGRLPGEAHLNVTSSRHDCEGSDGGRHF